MPVARFQMPDGRIARFEVPDGTTPEQAQAHFENFVSQQSGTDSQEEASNPVQPGEQQSLGERFARGAGLVGKGLAQGATSSLGMIGDALNTAVNFALPEGHKLGMPSQVMQRGLDAITPQAQGGAEKAVQFGATLAGGLLDPASKAIVAKSGVTPAQPRPPTPRENTIMEARRAGYVVPPSQGRGGLAGRVIEGFSNPSQLAHQAASRNQVVTDKLAKRAAGLAPEAELSDDALRAAINETYTRGYEPLAQAGRMTNGRIYRQNLDKVLSDYQGVSRSFPQAANDEVRQLVNSFRVRDYDAGDAIGAIRSLRESASGAFAAGKAELGKAQKAIAKALEDSIELNLSSRGEPGKAMLDAYRGARTQLAKQYTVRNAVREGSGSVDALKIASALQRGKPLTDELRTIGKFANTVPKVAGVPREMAQAPNLGGLPTAAAGVLAGPWAGAAVAGTPFARMGVRSGLLSQAGQRAFVDPKLKPSLMEQALSNPALLRMLPATQVGLFGE